MKLKSNTILYSILFFLIVQCLFLTCCVSSKRMDEGQNSSEISSQEVSIDEFKIETYLKKIWIVDKWESGVDYPISFVITQADGQTIGGYLRIDDFIDFQYFRRWDKKEIIPEFKGTMDSETAKCEYDYKNGNKGKFEIYFENDNNVKAKIDENESQVYNLRPYNISDLEICNEPTTYEVEIDSWGTVQLFYAVCDEEHPVPWILLTDNQGNILYHFPDDLTTGSEVKEVIIEDMNEDGLNDIKVVAYLSYAPDEYRFEDYFYQTQDGHFYLEESLNFGKEWGNM